ncbi:SDR family NAD(P)-dependent oxidoreductase [Glycomyces niveus]|uniref:SDR family NAD(P)-dependent oxidoreductase n=1 Tax=Glycomyces niveus TaxID=2820287 RepID=A0ABS3U2N8_9ACTN|nr:SDR family NAD(P)-dependent oxidoreductase [Glycomyces sp. NEAU-S30]MBO3732018.1 SDR family NAD(P)-dependent oxidoreductase [Glycomyces sp. NEAU-S30]
MSDKQQPIGSGFHARSTAADVLDGLDLTGKTAVVTGGYSGIGLETTRALANAGAAVVVPARRPDLAAANLDGIPGTEVDFVDLADLASVKAFAERRLAERRRIDYLVNGAGIMACPETRTDQGWELQFAVNHLGHFALVNRLMPLLEGARVVAVSSGGHGISPVRWDDPHFTEGYDRWQAYGQSKTANVLFAVELDRLGVKAFALHPGAILTPLQRHIPVEEQREMGWMDSDGNPPEYFKNTEQGAATQTWAATSPQLNGLGGVYLEDCEVAEVTAEGPGVRPHAVDPEQARRLWEYSAALTGVNAFA